MEILCHRSVQYFIGHLAVLKVRRTRKGCAYVGDKCRGHIKKYKAKMFFKNTCVLFFLLIFTQKALFVYEFKVDFFFSRVHIHIDDKVKRIIFT